MSFGPQMRASDADRDRTITLIREAYTEGRLTNDEFQQRMEQAQQSRTYGELASLTTDLPVVPVAPPMPVPAIPQTDAVVAERERADMRDAWWALLGVSALVNVIWGITWIANPGPPPYYWPIWVMGPWGAGLVFAWLKQREGGSREH